MRIRRGNPGTRNSTLSEFTDERERKEQLEGQMRSSMGLRREEENMPSL